jgi:NADH:ubiquinone oxidoreductase subunit 3 (subunit A)
MVMVIIIIIIIMTMMMMMMMTMLMNDEEEKDAKCSMFNSPQQPRSLHYTNNPLTFEVATGEVEGAERGVRAKRIAHPITQLWWEKK